MNCCPQLQRKPATPHLSDSRGKKPKTFLTVQECPEEADKLSFRVTAKPHSGQNITPPQQAVIVYIGSGTEVKERQKPRARRILFCKQSCRHLFPTHVQQPPQSSSLLPKSFPLLNRRPREPPRLPIRNMTIHGLDYFSNIILRKVGEEKAGINVAPMTASVV
jgi:hypothetical protein